MTTTAVGIDLGTTNSVVALSQGGKPRVLAAPDGSVLIPSVVSFHPNGQTVVGAAAKARRAIDPTNTVFSVKRLLGRPFNSEEVRRAKTRFPFELREGADSAINVNTRGGVMALPEISAFILREIRRIAEGALGSPVTRAVVTVPANFNELQRTATKFAGQIADLEVVRILNEPTAAALAYGYGRGTRERIAVYDFGGGTFDVTLLELSGNVFEVLSTAGDTFLGGDDVDMALAENLADALLQALRVDARQDPRAYELLRAAAEQAKMELSESDVATIRIPEIAYGPGGRALEFRTRISRPEIERLASPFVERTIEVCAEALKLAAISPQQCQTVILVGGSSRMPAVRRRVAEFFGRDPLTTLPPEQVVAMGASILAEALTGQRRRTTGSHSVPAQPATNPPSTAPAAPAVSPGRPSGVSGAGPMPTSTPPGARPVTGPTSARPFANNPPTPAVGTSPPVGARPTAAGNTSAPEPRPRIITYRGPAAPPEPAPAAPAAPAVSPRVSAATGRTEGSVPNARMTAPGPGAAPDLTGSGARRPPPGAFGQPALDDPLTPSGHPAGQYPNWLQQVAGQSAPPTPGVPAGPGMARAPNSELTWESSRNKSERPASVRPDALDDPFEDRPTFVAAPSVAPAAFPAPPATPSFTPAPGPLPSAPPVAMPPAPPPAPPPPPPMSRPMPHPGMRTAAMPTVAEPPAPIPEPARVANPIPPPVARTARSEPAPPMYTRQPTPPPGFTTSGSMASRLPSRPPAPLLLDVTPHSLGIETVGGLCEFVIRRNATIPVEQTREFATTYDGQEEVRIRIAQGESRRFAENQPLGELHLSGISRAPRGDVKIAVTFELDANGTLHVRAREVATGRETQTRVSLLTMPTAADAAGMAQRQRGAG